MKKFLITSFLISICANVSAVEYPAEIHGIWGTSAEYCPNLEIDKKFAVMGTEQTCEAKNVKNNNGKFQIKEICNGEGGSAAENSTYSLEGDTLIRSYRKFSNKYIRCGGAKPAAVAAPASNAAGAQTCSLIPGSAGVTTFLDDKLKKAGNAIRDIDGYVFKAEKKVKINKTDVLVGKLIRSDGSVSEAKSYAFADEWNCK